MFGGDRGKDFEDIGGFFHDGVAIRCREQFVDFFVQLVMQAPTGIPPQEGS